MGRRLGTLLRSFPVKIEWLDNSFERPISLLRRSIDAIALHRYRATDVATPRLSSKNHIHIFRRLIRLFSCENLRSFRGEKNETDFATSKN